MLVFAIASVYAGIRSRMRVRALIEEDAVPARPCTIARPRVERFLSETRVVRQLLDGLLDDAAQGIRGEIHDDNRLLFDLGAYSRAVAGWIRVYERDLDDEDREALAARGVEGTNVLSLREPVTDEPTAGLGTPEMRRHAALLERFEVVMTEAPRLAAYR
ncbi:MAG: hypothetical protein IAG13_27475 [Deltaproteobacteria bacterium]|nr:hypothetical protein [Nannocystaceae bacterium]